jgi:hypothetical protein
MASPLSILRKYQKSLLVVFGILLMVAFLLADIAGRVGNGGRTREVENPVLVKWKNGEFKQDELGQLLFHNNTSAQFVTVLQQNAYSRLQEKYVPQAEPIRSVSSPDAPQEQNFRAIMNVYLKAQRAKELGVTVNDVTVDAYLDAIANEDLDDSQYQQLARDVFQQSGMYFAIKKHLQIELAALAFDQMERAGVYVPGHVNFQAQIFRQNTAALSPTERWRGFYKTNKRIECEVYPVMVSDFVDQVDEEPSDSELKKLFEKGKFSYGDARHVSLYDPESLEPGFKILPKLNISYFHVDPIAFRTMAKQELTAEQVKAEYDRLVEIQDPLVVIREERSLDFPNLDFPPGLNDGNLPDQNQGGDGNNEGQNNSEAGKEEIPTPPDLNSDPTKKGNEETEKTGENKQSTNKDEGSNSNAEKKESDGQNQDGSSSLIPGSRNIAPPTMVYTSYQQEEGNQQNESGETNDQDQKDSASTQQNTQDQTEQQESIPQPPVVGQTQNDAAKPNDLPPTPPGVEPTVPKVDQGPRIKPLTPDLEDRIRSLLADEPAKKAQLDAVNLVNKKLSDYRIDYDYWKNEPDVEEPKPFDGASIARQSLLKYGKTGLVDAIGVKSTDFGKSSEVHRVFNSANVLDPYKPFEIPGPDEQTTFLAWITDKRDSEVPEFEDVRDEVLEYWKNIQAIDLAKRQAEKIKKQINGTEKTLLTEFPQKALATGGFTWISSIRQTPYTVSNDKVEKPGEEFMKTAFNLNKLECGVAANADKSIIYVIQLIKDTQPFSSSVEEEFIELLNRTNGLQFKSFGGETDDFERSAMNYRINAIRQLEMELEEEMQVQWLF